MKRIFTKIVLLSFACSSLIVPLNAQDFEELIKSGTEDANTYLSKYMNPFAGSLGNGLASGWYNTAKPHKTLGFDITGSIGLAVIPDASKIFTFNESEYNNLSLTPAGSGDQLPTFIGGEYTGGGQLQVDGSRELAPGVSFSGDQQFAVPDGLDLDFPGPLAVPVPNFQLGVGIIKNTDIIIRYTPELNFDGVSFKQFGLGIKHDVKQWIPGMKLLPFDLSALIAYSNINATYQIDEDNDQFAEFKASTTTFQVLVSKKLLFFTPYAGVGINAINSTFDVKGDYTFSDNGLGGSGETVTVTDPVSLNFEGNGGARLTVGARFKILWVVAAHIDYTFQTYNTLNVGFGINIR